MIAVLCTSSVEIYHVKLQPKTNLGNVWACHCPEDQRWNPIRPFPLSTARLPAVLVMFLSSAPLATSTSSSCFADVSKQCTAEGEHR